MTGGILTTTINYGISNFLSSRSCNAVMCYICRGSWYIFVLAFFMFHSSYALKDETIIEVLFTEEPLLIEGPERNQQTMLIEPRKTSIQDVKEFIAAKIGIPLEKQRVSYCGKDMCDSNSPSLLHIFITAKATPVFKVSALIENSEPPKERKQRGFGASRYV